MVQRLRSSFTILLLSIAIAALSVVTVGCTSKTNPPDREQSPASPSKTEPGEERAVSDAMPDLSKSVQEAKSKYPDAVGWLQIPGTSIDDVVVWNPDSNDAYIRSNLDGEYDFDGVYYADFRSILGNGSRSELGVNTCIYGHAMTDNPEREQYSIRFGPLHDYRNPEYARSMPYILFSTGSENMVFEVFAVFAANADNPNLPFNRSDVPPEDFVNMIENEVIPRSLYHYEDVAFSPSDKFLTLSTCIYTMPDGTRLDYKTSEMRYAVMAKLVDPATPLKETARFEENPDIRIDPDGSWPK